MKLVYGAGAAREALTRLREEVTPLSPMVAQRLREAFGEEVTPERAVERIIAEVAARGDDALRHYARKFDGWAGGELRLPPQEMEAACAGLEPVLRASLQQAAERIRSFHQECLFKGWFDQETGLGQIVRPLERVGAYVPGGTAAYPSTVLHTVIPAKVAGVREVIVATPPQPDGQVPPAVLAAAAISGATAVFRIGGAQAIAALAFGTQSVPKVDKIVGPGNIFVTLAKRKVYGVVGIDGLHGPTETLIIADDGAPAATVAADLLAQAEHDALATPVLLTASRTLALAVAQEVGRRVGELERRDIAGASLAARGLIGVVGSVPEAIDLANEFAPEHLCLLVRDASSYLDQVRNAGGVFLGEGSPEVLGDYNAGPSHVMPTGGTARFGSALGVQDFLKVISVVGLTPAAGRRLARAAGRIARAEGLTGHARSAEMRAPGGPEGSADEAAS